jgi:hypothetical protein
MAEAEEMAEMGGPGGVVKARDLVEADGPLDRALGGSVHADRRDRERNRVLGRDRVERVLCRIPVGRCWLRPLGPGSPNSAGRPGRQGVLPLVRGRVAGRGFRQGRPPRVRPLAGMLGPSRQAEVAGAGRRHRAFPAPDPARDCLAHDRGDRRQDRFRVENPRFGDRDAARYPA